MRKEDGCYLNVNRLVRMRKHQVKCGSLSILYLNFGWRESQDHALKRKMNHDKSKGGGDITGWNGIQK